MTANSYCNDDDVQPYNSDPMDQDSQYAHTPGYYSRTPASGLETSPSPNYYSEDDQEVSQSEPERPRLLQLSK